MAEISMFILVDLFLQGIESLMYWSDYMNLLIILQLLWLAALLCLIF